MLAQPRQHLQRDERDALRAAHRLMGAWGGGFTAVFVMFAAVLVAGSIGVVALGEETRGRTLEEISAGL